MKPDWDKLMKEFADSPTAGVFDVDCTADGKPLCESNGVRGYPTIKYGDPNNLEDYKGGRDYDALYKFASENLKPVCSPTNIDLCDDEKKAEIEKFTALGEDELDKLIKAKEEEQEEAEKNFKDEVGKLQATYQKLMEDKDAKMEEIKKSGLGLMKAVKATMGKKGSDEL
jgi:hypothetical protein